MGVIISTAKSAENSWIISNKGFRMLRPLFEAELEGDDAAIKEIEDGENIGAVMLEFLLEEDVDLALRLARAIKRVADGLASGHIELCEYESVEEKREAQLKFFTLAELATTFIDRYNR
jgi:hypothetical protein